MWSSEKILGIIKLFFSTIVNHTGEINLLATNRNKKKILKFSAYFFHVISLTTAIFCARKIHLLITNIYPFISS